MTFELSEIAFFFFSSRRRHTSSFGDWSSDVCSSDLWGERQCTRGDNPVLCCLSVAALLVGSSVLRFLHFLGSFRRLRLHELCTRLLRQEDHRGTDNTGLRCILDRGVESFTRICLVELVQHVRST